MTDHWLRRRERFTRLVGRVHIGLVAALAALAAAHIVEIL